MRSQLKHVIHHRSARFLRFEHSLHSETVRKHDAVLSWAASAASQAETLEAEHYYSSSSDPIVRQGFALRKEALQRFANVCSDRRHLRVLLHMPPASTSPGGHSAFTNLWQSLVHLGVAAEVLRWNDALVDRLSQFQPTVLMTSDHPSYLNRLDWRVVNDYRRSHSLELGITASLASAPDGTLQSRLNWASAAGVTFYYSWHAPEFISSNYQPFLARGYQICSVEFGANPLVYYPVPAIERDLSYVFLASTNRRKWPRYYSFLAQLLRRHAGFVDGPGWHFSDPDGHPQLQDRYLYARGQVGINLHISSSITAADELNERTYILAACGVPQLVDNAKLLPTRFSPDAMFVASTPTEYLDLFEWMLSSPEDAQRGALLAQREVFDRHTTFSRAITLVEFLSDLVDKR